MQFLFYHRPIITPVINSIAVCYYWGCWHFSQAKFKLMNSIIKWKVISPVNFPVDLLTRASNKAYVILNINGVFSNFVPSFNHFSLYLHRFHIFMRLFTKISAFLLCLHGILLLSAIKLNICDEINEICNFDK